MQKLLSLVRAAVDKYNMIENGDKIAVCVSGGKDSVALLKCMAELRRFYPKEFELCAVRFTRAFSVNTAIIPKLKGFAGKITFRIQLSGLIYIM